MPESDQNNNDFAFSKKIILSSKLNELGDEKGNMLNAFATETACQLNLVKNDLTNSRMIEEPGADRALSFSFKLCLHTILWCQVINDLAGK